MNNIVSIQEVKQLGENLLQKGQKIVLVGGCFDLLHFGHIAFLEEAKAQADILVVLLESDKRIQALKGSQRPLHTQTQRAHMLSALMCVDYIVLLPDAMQDSDYETVVKQMQPAIIAATKEADSLKYIQRQARENNVSVYLVEPVKNLSTSRILEVVTKEL